MASSLYTAGSALGFACSRYADVPIDTICTFIAFSWISHVLFERKSYNNDRQRNRYGPA